MRLKFYIALLIALTPGLAQAKPHSGSTHMRPQLFRDRTPKAHPPATRPHEIKVPQPKSPPPPPVKEDY
jgi:hypothetical protein